MKVQEGLLEKVQNAEGKRQSAETNFKDRDVTCRII
jgi:hypothetical protein